VSDKEPPEDQGQPEPEKPSPDPLDAVATATAAWATAIRAYPERVARDRAIVAAFDAGSTGREVAAASGMDLEEVFKIHRRSAEIRSDADMERRLAETGRRNDEVVSKMGAVTEDMIREVVARLPRDSGVVRRIDPELADRMLRCYSQNRGKYGI